MLDQILSTQLLIAGGIVGIAYLVRGVAGFGSGLIAIPLLALILPLTIVVPLVVLLDYLASAAQGLNNRAEIQWQEIVSLLPFSLMGVAAALYLFRVVDVQLLSKGLGLFILLYAGYTLIAKESGNLGSRLWAAPAGVCGGLIGTLFGTGGPFYVLYLKHRGLAKSRFRATFATVFLLDGAARLTGYLYFGFYERDNLGLIALCLPIMAAGIFIGGRIHTGMSQKSFQTALSMLLLVSGTSLMLK